MIRGLPLEEGFLDLRILAVERWPSRIGTVRLDSMMSGAVGRVALMVEMVVSITDLIASTSFQFAGGLRFAVANCGGLAGSFTRGILVYYLDDFR